jgi:hypothetical protein
MRQTISPYLARKELGSEDIPMEVRLVLVKVTRRVPCFLVASSKAMLHQAPRKRRRMGTHHVMTVPASLWFRFVSVKSDSIFGEPSVFFFWRGRRNLLKSKGTRTGLYNQNKTAPRREKLGDKKTKKIKQKRGLRSFLEGTIGFTIPINRMVK